MRQQLFQFACCLFAAVCFQGCDSGLDDAPETGDVSGTVTMNDKPLANANISFQSAKNRPAYGTTDAEGKYTLTFSKTQTGAAIGENLVSITSGGSTEGEYSASDEENKSDPKIPAKYNSENKTNPEMKVDVKAGSNEFNFNLKSDK